MDDQKLELKQALKSASNILSKRPHSLNKLKQKLSLKYSASIVTEVLKVAQEKKWLIPEDTLSKQVTTTLHQKNKSWNYIKNYLKKESLPLPEYNREREIEKIHQLLAKKNLTAKLQNLEDQQKARRLLLYRGFEEDVIKEVLSEESLF